MPPSEDTLVRIHVYKCQCSVPLSNDARTQVSP